MWTNEYQPRGYGLQVLLSAYNAEEHMERCLKSLDNSLKDYDWILLYGDDGCTDETTIELAKYARELTCDKVHLHEYDKASSIGQAKNRLIKEAHVFKNKYQYILFMDADDEMLPERPRMVRTAIDTQSQYVVGTWTRTKSWSEAQVVPSIVAGPNLSFGPWATLFHIDFLPEDGRFFPEDELCNTGYEDILTWHHLKHIEDKMPTIHHSDQSVHNYIVHSESASNTRDIKVLNKRRNTFWGISELIKDTHRNIYDNPITLDESEAATLAYSQRNKNKQKAQNPLL